MKFLRKLFLDGLLIAIPLALVGVLAYYVIDFLKEVVQPLVALLPVKSVLGIGLLTIAAVLALILLILFFGLLVRWKARGLAEGFERKVLNRIPVYTIVKRLSQDVVDPEGHESAVLVDLHGTGVWSLGIVIEETGDGRLVVFLPDAPTASGGTVHVVAPERARPLKINALEVIDVLGNRGMGASRLLDKKSEPKGPSAS